MAQHPIAELEAKAKAQADKFDKRPHLWWAEYRDAYANAAGLGDDVPIEPELSLQNYLTQLDRKILQLRAEFRKEQVQ
jgi:hypothetical protein